METDILEILKQIQKDNKEFRNEVNSKFDEVNSRLDKVDVQFDNINNRFNKLETKFDNLSKTVEIIYDQTVTLSEFRNEVNSKLEELTVVKAITKENCYEIAKIKAVK